MKRILSITLCAINISGSASDDEKKTLTEIIMESGEALKNNQDKVAAYSRKHMETLKEVFGVLLKARTSEILSTSTQAEKQDKESQKDLEAAIKVMLKAGVEQGQIMKVMEGYINKTREEMEKTIKENEKDEKK